MTSLTPEQLSIIKTIPLDQETSWVIEARAGSGKTFTLLQLAPHLPPGTRMLAFNKAIADELSAKLPPSIPASTFHSLGMTLLRERLPRFKVNSRKLSDLATNLALTPTFPYTQLVDQAKTSGLGLPGFPPLEDEEAWIWLVDTYDIELPKGESLESFIAKSLQLFKASTSDFKTIDFTDMLYLPLALAQRFNWTYDKFPLLVVDEAQDVSPLRLSMLRALTNRLIAVGDPYQAIYGFTGAMNGALESITTHYSASTLPLSVSFRCGTAIIDEARSLISPAKILPREDAHTGTVQHLPSLPPLTDTSMTLCRTNPPLFELAMRLIRQNQPFRLRSDLPRKLISFVTRFKAKNLQQFEVRLNAWYDSEIPRLESQGRKGAINAAQEKFDTLKYLISEHTDLEGLVSTLQRLLLPSRGPLLSTIHKSKGLEAPVVHLLRPDLLPHPMSSSQWELEQENNLHYVAVTRAIDEFNYIGS